METSVAMVKRPDPEYQGLVMHCSPAEARRRMQELQAFVAEAMDGPVYGQDGKTVVRDGTDYGTIPGTNKPTLYQPGAQKLCEMYGLAADFAIDEKIEDWDKPFFYYRFRAVLTDRRTGAFVGVGIGSANSREKKYAGRWVAESDVPSWLDKKALKKREGMEWLWKSKVPAGVDLARLPMKDRTGKDGTSYKVYGVQTTQFFVPNEDICDCVNTLQKMAAKRAHVHAVLQVTRSAGVFSQDLEDLPEEVRGTVDERRSWEREPQDAEFSEKPAPSLSTEKAGGSAATHVSEPDWAAKLAACKSRAEVNGIVAEMVRHYGQGKTPAHWQEVVKKRGVELTPPPAPALVPCRFPGCTDRMLPEAIEAHMAQHPKQPAQAPKVCDGEHDEPSCGRACWLADPDEAQVGGAA